MQPDPEAVREALEEIDEAERRYQNRDWKPSMYAALVFMERREIITAARAWLAAQNAKGEASE